MFRNGYFGGKLTCEVYFAAVDNMQNRMVSTTQRRSRPQPFNEVDAPTGAPALKEHTAAAAAKTHRTKPAKTAKSSR